MAHSIVTKITAIVATTSKAIALILWLDRLLHSPSIGLCSNAAAYSPP